MTPDVRRVLRNRARYEVANNAYAKGMVLTIAGDCIGTGPRLQFLLDNAKANRIIEQAFADWAGAIDLPTTLRAMRMAKATDGEAFAVLINNPGLGHAVSLDLRLIEADRVTTPWKCFRRRNMVDGIALDRFGNPTAYHVVKGVSDTTVSLPGQSERIPADAMIHWYRAKKCDIASALVFARKARVSLARTCNVQFLSQRFVLNRNTAEEAQSHGKSMQIVPIRGKPVGTTFGTLVYAFALSLGVSKGWEIRRLASEAEGYWFEPSRGY